MDQADARNDPATVNATTPGTPVAALSIWNVGVAFLFGLATQWLLRRKLLEL